MHCSAPPTEVLGPVLAKDDNARESLIIFYIPRLRFLENGVSKFFDESRTFVVNLFILSHVSWLYTMVSASAYDFAESAPVTWRYDEV